MKPCISQVTTLSATFAEDIAAYADAGWHAVEVWLTKLEAHLEQHSANDTRKLLEDREMVPAAASFQGGLLQSAGQQRQAHFDHFRRRLDICQGLGIRILIVAADFHSAVDAAGVEQALATLREAARWAAGTDVTLALEFVASSRFCNNLETARALVEAAGEPNVAINLDLFHFHAGPSKMADLSHLAPRQLAFVQACDLAGGLRELITDADRILPGDGDLDLAGIFRSLEDIGYNGFVSLELMNPALWRMKPAQVAEIGRMAVERVLGNPQKNNPQITPMNADRS